MIRYLLAQQQHRNFAEQQVQDIQSELERVQRVIHFETLQRSIQSMRPPPVLKADEQAAIVQIEYLARKIGRFTNDDRQKFDGLIKKLQHLSNVLGLGINEEERVAIVKALNMGGGHWYTCPNGHPYIITEV